MDSDIEELILIPFAFIFTARITGWAVDHGLWIPTG